MTREEPELVQNTVDIIGKKYVDNIMLFWMSEDFFNGAISTTEFLEYDLVDKAILALLLWTFKIRTTLNMT